MLTGATVTGLYTPNPIPALIPASRIPSLWNGAKASASSSVSVRQYRTKRFYLQMVLSGVICGAARLVHRLHATTTPRMLSIEQVSRFMQQCVPLASFWCLLMHSYKLQFHNNSMYLLSDIGSKVDADDELDIALGKKPRETKLKCN